MISNLISQTNYKLKILKFINITKIEAKSIPNFLFNFMSFKDVLPSKKKDLIIGTLTYLCFIL